LEKFGACQVFFREISHILQKKFFPNQNVVEIKNPPMKVGGSQFGWFKETLVPSALANAERLFHTEGGMFSGA
jgi:hypothetical protein